MKKFPAFTPQEYVEAINEFLTDLSPDEYKQVIERVLLTTPLIGKQLGWDFEIKQPGSKPEA